MNRGEWGKQVVKMLRRIVQLDTNKPDFYTRVAVLGELATEAKWLLEQLPEGDGLTDELS